jgi:hypothetical protein
MTDPRELAAAADKALEGPEPLDLLAFHLRNLPDSAPMDQIDADRISRAADAVSLLPAMRDALRAAVAPRVKALEWEARTDMPGLHNAKSPIGWWYNVHELNDGRFKYDGDPCALPQNMQPSAHPTLEAAKAAAQADYEARILSALDTAPAEPWQPPVEREPGYRCQITIPATWEPWGAAGNGCWVVTDTHLKDVGIPSDAPTAFAPLPEGQP